GGQIRRIPSAQAMYQSGCDPAETIEAMYGPTVQTGLIWKRPDINDVNPVTRAKNAPPFSANIGMIRTPTTFFSDFRTPGNWVCFWYHTNPRCTAIRASMIPGTNRMCSVYSRGMNSPVPGYSPPNSAQCNQVPITGMDSTMPDSVARTPVPDSRSSGSE